jgi:succinate-semialdehyde dehydrogenase/glutarate-semialdehyde dehydrogenase
VGRSGFGRSHGDEALLDATWLQAIDVPRGPAFGPKRPWWYPYAGVDKPLATLGRTLGRDDLIGRVTGGVQLGSQLIKTLTRFPKL